MNLQTKCLSCDIMICIDSVDWLKVNVVMHSFCELVTVNIGICAYPCHQVWWWIMMGTINISHYGYTEDSTDLVSGVQQSWQALEFLSCGIKNNNKNIFISDLNKSIVEGKYMYKYLQVYK